MHRLLVDKRRGRNRPVEPTFESPDDRLDVGSQLTGGAKRGEQLLVVRLAGGDAVATKAPHLAFDEFREQGRERPDSGGGAELRPHVVAYRHPSRVVADGRPSVSAGSPGALSRSPTHQTTRAFRRASRIHSSASRGGAPRNSRMTWE